MRVLGLLTLYLLFAAPPAWSQLELLATWDGPTTGEQFGIALAIGGDADDDGRADLAIGASTSDEGGDNAGKVSVFFGRSTPSADPDLELLGAPGSFFGAAVAWAGDTNGDAFDDLLVGAFRDDEIGTNAGKAYLFLGGDPMDAVPDLVMTGSAAGDYFGRAVAGAGDLNGDQVADFAVGAPRTANGTVYVYYGGNPPDAVPDLIIQGLVEDDRFGSAIAGVRNADGQPGDDLLVGAPRASTTHLWQGEVYLFSGGPTFDAIPDWTVRDEEAGAHLGTSVAAAGDINGDGGLDLVAGAPYRNAGISLDVGAAYLFYGGALLDTEPDLIIEGAAGEENLGQSVAGCGDLTGNGFGHLLVGAPGYNTGGSDVGKIIVIPGGDPPLPDDVVEFYGEADNDQFGFAVAGGAPGPERSFTGNTQPDIAAGAWGHGDGGRCYLFGIAGGSGDIAAEDRGPLRAPSRLSLCAAPNPARSFSLHLTGAVVRGDPSATRESMPNGGIDEVRIVALDGAVIRRIPVSASAGGAGYAVARWDGLDRAGFPVPTGIYLAIAAGSREPVGSARLLLLR